MTKPIPTWDCSTLVPGDLFLVSDLIRNNNLVEDPIPISMTIYLWKQQDVWLGLGTSKHVHYVLQ